MTSATDHVCAKCGKQLDPVNWWTASVTDRYGGRSFKLCKPCAVEVSFAIQLIISVDGYVEGVEMR